MVTPPEFDGDRTDTQGGSVRIRPVGQGRPCLIMMTGAFPGETYLIEPGAELTIGRGAGNDIRLPYGDVSRVHARMKCSASGKVEVIDLGSTNGTFVNGRRQLYRVLREGDKIQFGEGTVFRFAFHDELDEEFQRRLFGVLFLDRTTSCLTRERLLSVLEEDLAGEAPVAVVVMGIDGFPLLEELLGHAVRDYLLRELTWVIRKSFAGEGTLYRVGLDTFATVFKGLSRDEALATAERIRRVVSSSRLTYQGDQMVFSLGIGVACRELGGCMDASDLLALGEERGQRARHAGGDRVEAAGG